MMKKEDILAKVKTTVQQIDAHAEVILFGSHARGNARSDSDWDFLILVSEPLDKETKNLIWDALYEQVELPTQQIISSIIHEKKKWHHQYRITPLYQTIEKEGQLL